MSTLYIMECGGGVGTPGLSIIIHENDVIRVKLEAAKRASSLFKGGYFVFVVYKFTGSINLATAENICSIHVSQEDPRANVRGAV